MENRIQDTRAEKRSSQENCCRAKSREYGILDTINTHRDNNRSLDKFIYVSKSF